MGLAEVKRKQRLVGSARTKNSAWSNDATLPGQRLLSSMGWNAGQGLGLHSKGDTNPIVIPIKLDNTGIGVQRAQKEAKASHGGEWFGSNGELDSIYAQLNTDQQDERSPAFASTSSSEEQREKEGRGGGKSKESNLEARGKKEVGSTTLSSAAAVSRKEQRISSKGERKKRKRSRTEEAEEKSSERAASKGRERGGKERRKKKERHDLVPITSPERGDGEQSETEAPCNTTSSYGVFQYLSNRLIVRRAQVRKKQQSSIYSALPTL